MTKHDCRLSQYRSKATRVVTVTDIPTHHESYAWVSQDGKVTKIQDLDDRHLINIYRMLVKSADYLGSLDISTDSFDLFSENQTKLNHVEFEISLRGLIITEFELYKTIAVKTVCDLLKMGCQIQFPNGYVLKGDPQSGYIETNIIIAGELSNDGLRPLDETGTVDALNDAMSYSEDNELG